MNNKESIEVLLDYLQTEEGGTFRYDEAAIVATHENNNEEQSLVIKILSILGGILASFAFIGFLLIAGLAESEAGLVIFGLLCISGAIILKKAFDKIIIDTISVSAFIIGFTLLTFGMVQIQVGSNIVCVVLMLIALVSLVIIQSYILSFIAVLIINGSLYAILIANNAYELIPFYIGVFALLNVFIFLKEGKIITSTKAFSKLYNPIRIAFVLTFLAGLILLLQGSWLHLPAPHHWIPSVITIASLVYVAYLITDILKIARPQYKIISCLLTFIALLPTALSPSVSGAMLIILLSFLVNYKTGFVIGVIAFIYCISQFYYDLHLTLLVKSLLLISSGVVFLFLYLFTHKKLSSNEKI